MANEPERNKPCPCGSSKKYKKCCRLTSPQSSVFPYEQQYGERTCGAACLVMIYRSFDMNVSQDDVWEQINSPDKFGEKFCKTFKMVRDVQERGFAAAALQAIDPIRALGVCRANGARVILNHQSFKNAELGHYTVMMGLDNHWVLLHDPDGKPARPVQHSDLVEKWKARGEITGNVMIVCSLPVDDAFVCTVCGIQLRNQLNCKNCSKLLGSLPMHALGCLNHNCDSSLWTFLFCPQCDYANDLIVPVTKD